MYRISKDRRQLSLPSFINLHAHITHHKRFNEFQSPHVLESKPYRSEYNKENMSQALIESIHHGTKILATSLRPEEVNLFLEHVLDYSIIVVPYISVKNYHNIKEINAILIRIEKFYKAHNIPIRPGILIHSLYNITAETFYIFYQHCKNNNYSLSIHFFEWESELHFYNEKKLKNHDIVFEKLLSRWNVEDYINVVDNLMYSDLGIEAAFIHCCYMPKLKKPLSSSFRAVLCPISNIRLGNNVPIISKFQSYCIATDGYYSNSGYNLISEVRFFYYKNITSPLLMHNIHELLYAITVNPLKMMSSKNICNNIDMLCETLTPNIYEKVSGHIPENNPILDFILYHDSYMRIFD